MARSLVSELLLVSVALSFLSLSLSLSCLPPPISRSILHHFENPVSRKSTDALEP